MTMPARPHFLLVLAGAGLLTLPTGSGSQTVQVPDQAETIAVPELEVHSGLVVASYEHGKLTVSVGNVPLGQVLRAICSQIGAELEAESESSEPVIGSFGPDDAKAVLTSLLVGSNLNYVMQASDEDPTHLARLIVIQKSNDSSDPYRAAQVSQPKVRSKPPTVVGNKSSTNELVALLEDANTEGAIPGGVAADAEVADQGVAVDEVASSETATTDAETQPTTAVAESDANAASHEAVQQAVPAPRLGIGRRRHRRR